MATKNAILTGDPIGVAAGGIGAATLTDHGVLVGAGTNAITPLSVGSTGELLVGITGADPAFGTSATSDFTFTSSTADQQRLFIVENTDNGGTTSRAQIDIRVGGDNVGDPQLNYVVTGETTWSTGIDNSDTDKYKISQGAVLGTNDVFVFTNTGAITMPLQPAFGAKAALQSDVTGDGTVYTITFTDAEYFDQNDDFDGTSTFTAPVAGLYQFNSDINTGGITASHTDGYITLSTSNRDYLSDFVSPAAARSSSDSYSFNMSILVDMDVSDTAVMKITVSNDTKVIDIKAGNVFFNGYLAC
jgi:hypothetical protein